jgi:hypothetical protein
VHPLPSIISTEYWFYLTYATALSKNNKNQLRNKTHLSQLTVSVES